ncbi:EAL domain-containing protein [Methylobacillus gramineus]|uniref:putative bifunctional diguanylate cyclase/phosphodiesterase n=1 Tax=Methylobacillus gramineus TaxID=755169 RepID=UPI001CFF6A6E|nr:EAL domain-containing protein [Methylobacillus gramineus]MCB5183874.1 EAL domain-containing protein [Methylobacillus gramineus]
MTSSSYKSVPPVLRKVHILAVGLALLIATFSLILVEYATLKSSLSDKLQVQMQIVASNITQTLDAGKHKSIENVLSSLSAAPEIDAVALYGLQQERIAHYVRNGQLPDMAAKSPVTELTVNTNLLNAEIWQPVMEKGHQRAVLYARANLKQLYRNLLWYIGTTIMVMLVTLYAAASLLSRLQRAVLQAEERAGFLTNYDTVTHLLNRYAFNQRFQTLLDEAQQKSSVLALLVFDLDDFKVVNDTLGHDVGDMLLRVVAQRMVATGNLDHVIYRVGGDEFAMILEKSEEVENIHAIANRFIEALAAPIAINDRNLYVGVSIGASLYPYDGEDAAHLLRDADAAMYYAKSRGKNNFQMFSVEMHHKSSNRLTLESEMRVALEQGQFELHYQPQIALPSQKLIGVEALIRWNHPQRGVLMPSNFIPIAEEVGLIVPIGQWVLREACQQAMAWKAAGIEGLRMSVNLSGRQFRQESLVNGVTQIIEETHMDTDLLELEITETVLMEDAETTITRLKELKAMGIHLSIDDFGTGYSSMAYLKRFPVSRLKIDRSFIRDIPLDADDVAITTATIQMAHSLKLEVVAEGVENQVQLQFLCAQGCDIAQGFLFSQPVDRHAMTEIAKARET